MIRVYHLTAHPLHMSQDVIGEDASMKWGKTTLEQCLSALDRHLIALLEEIDVDLTLEWMQQSVKELVDLFVQASVIKDADFDYIGEVVLARLKFIAKHIPKEQRRQEYLLGLPNEDCEMIKQNETELMEWYKGCNAPQKLDSRPKQDKLLFQTRRSAKWQEPEGHSRPSTRRKWCWN